MIQTPSSPAVAASLWLLGVFSVATWALILAKAIQYGLNARRNRRFAKKFWAATNLQAAADVTRDARGESALARIATAGLKALTSSGADPVDAEHVWDRHDQLQRNLSQQLKRERRVLDAGVAVLASVGSTAPFVGLFGTVWGIMSAMHDISRNGNASIDVVAGPIGEALIATGIGIAVAIPAVLAYNFFVRRLRSVLADYEDFAHEFVNLTHRATFRPERALWPVDEGKSAARETRPERAPGAPSLVVTAGKSS
jgi:biopolymer transport protein ExbB